MAAMRASYFRRRYPGIPGMPDYKLVGDNKWIAFYRWIDFWAQDPTTIVARIAAWKVIAEK